MAKESKVAIYTSIVANVVIATTKLVTAALTGSSAMVAEGVHSLVDAGDGTLLLVGQARARRPPDELHPFGHGKELYFWALIVAMIFFAVGGGVSVYEGILHLLHPEPLRDPTTAYIVLGVAALFDGGSLVVGYRQVRKAVPNLSPVQVVRRGKDPSLFTVLLEDVADIAGLTIAFLGVWLGHALSNPYLDGVASIGVGLVLATVALVLMGQSRALLVGERASPEVLEAVEAAAGEDPALRGIARPLTMQLGPNEVLLALRAEFVPELSSREVAAAITRLERRIRSRCPEVRQIYVEAASLEGSGDDGSRHHP
jgi:cation diffusion facilitator family transporter